jgi:hypothetical protein
MEKDFKQKKHNVEALSSYLFQQSRLIAYGYKTKNKSVHDIPLKVYGQNRFCGNVYLSVYAKTQEHDLVASSAGLVAVTA